ncbi:MAG: hypothetical protein AB8B97_23870 [Granulosicoccus sp.]
MFSRQKKLLAQAEQEHSFAVEQKNAARQQLSYRRNQFLGEPLNLLYPFAAGALVCASQLKNEAKGWQRIPFLNLAKMAVGVWATTERIRKIRKSQTDAASGKKSGR